MLQIANSVLALISLLEAPSSASPQVRELQVRVHGLNLEGGVGRAGGRFNIFFDPKNGLKNGLKTGPKVHLLQACV